MRIAFIFVARSGESYALALAFALPQPGTIRYPKALAFSRVQQREDEP
jgi:hypothetical protein